MRKRAVAVCVLSLAGYSLFANLSARAQSTIVEINSTASAVNSIVVADVATTTKPEITRLYPTEGPEGTLVTLAGANFGSVAGTVTLSGIAALVVNWSSSTIMVAVPSGATSGNVVVTVGGVASNGVHFTVEPLQLPSRAQVLTAIEKVNNYWIAHNKPGNADWDQATYFTGDLVAYDATGQADYLSFAKSWASQNNYSLIGGNTTTFADYQAAGRCTFAYTS